MTTSAIIMMILVQLTVTIITAFFFVKVLKTPKKSGPDTYTDEE